MSDYTDSERFEFILSKINEQLRLTFGEDFNIARSDIDDCMDGRPASRLNHLANKFSGYGNVKLGEGF